MTLAIVEKDFENVLFLYSIQQNQYKFYKKKNLILYALKRQLSKLLIILKIKT